MSDLIANRAARSDAAGLDRLRGSEGANRDNLGTKRGVTAAKSGGGCFMVLGDTELASIRRRRSPGAEACNVKGTPDDWDQKTKTRTPNRNRGG